MRETQAERDPTMMNESISSRLEAAIRNWYEARHHFQVESTSQNQNCYERAYNQLGRAISFWKSEQPELFEQFRLWFAAHPQD